MKKQKKKSKKVQVVLARLTCHEVDSWSVDQMDSIVDWLKKLAEDIKYYHQKKGFSNRFITRYYQP